MTSPLNSVRDPLLSVVIPARNSAAWIGELLESILAQNIERLEVLVIDNGSADDTAEVVERCRERDSRLRLIRSRADSAATARNEGVAHAAGEYLVFADADDIVPDGAYRSMLEALEESGSDMVIGDHLKFSPTTTWSPTRRWWAFDESLRGVQPDDVPELLSGRACWNRMFRRSFWDRVGLQFPAITNVDDIEPMTRAFVSAESIDVVAAQVYLYRDRYDGSSISQRADASTTVRYLQQEAACAALVEDRVRSRMLHAEVVLDADGWAHLMRFVRSAPSAEEINAVREALRRLLDVIPLDSLTKVAPVRRALWALVLSERWDDATEFARGSVSTDAQVRLHAWFVAVLALQNAEPGEIDLGRLVGEGLVPALINDADVVASDWLSAALARLSNLPIEAEQSELRNAMSRALQSGDSEAVSLVSSLRRVVPLVVNAASPNADGLDLSGALPPSLDPPEMTLELRNGHDVIALPVSVSSGSWIASIDGDTLPSGRWTATVRVVGLSEEFPVVTARMPLPPVEAGFPVQPLADRKAGWRFLVDRRPTPRRGLGALARRVRDRLR